MEGVRTPVEGAAKVSHQEQSEQEAALGANLSGSVVAARPDIPAAAAKYEPVRDLEEGAVQAVAANKTQSGRR